MLLELYQFFFLSHLTLSAQICKSESFTGVRDLKGTEKPRARKGGGRGEEVFEKVVAK